MFSTFRSTTLAAVVVGLGLLAAGSAKADLITYDFTVTATTGPLAGTMADGTFSYDSSSIVLGGVNSASPASGWCCGCGGPDLTPAADALRSGAMEARWQSEIVTRWGSRCTL
jgi:hypothetical protein